MPLPSSIRYVLQLTHYTYYIIPSFPSYTLYTTNYDIYSTHIHLLYTGETEAALTEFILTKLTSQCTPEALQEEMTAVLDDDAETFVIKLWRMLIFSILKITSS